MHTHIPFYIKTFKIAPTCFDPNIFRELYCSLLNSHLKNFLADQFSGTVSGRYKLKSKLESKLNFDMGLSPFLSHYSK